MAKELIEYAKQFDWSNVDKGDLSESDWCVASEGDLTAIELKHLGRQGSLVPRASYALPMKRGIKVINIADPNLFFQTEPICRISEPIQGLLPELVTRWSRVYKNAIDLFEPSWTEDDPDDYYIATVPELARILADINDLAFQMESDDFGLLRPSYYALTTCLKTILELARNGELSRPSDISTDRNGDIRITWAADDREAELIFPYDEKEGAYLYYSSPASYGTEKDLSPESISKKVRWAIGGQSE